jgi:hypothetical protein
LAGGCVSHACPSGPTVEPTIKPSAWWDDEHRVRAGLSALVERATSDFVLECVGAGPLEGFVCDDESRIRWIESVDRGPLASATRLPMHGSPAR